VCVCLYVCVCECVCVNYVMKDDKIGGARSKRVGEEKCIQDLVVQPEEKRMLRVI